VRQAVRKLVEALNYTPKVAVWMLMRSLDVDLISFQPHNGPWGWLSLYKNGYQESSWWLKRGQRVEVSISLQSVSRLSRKCGSLDISQHYMLPRPVTGIASTGIYAEGRGLNADEVIGCWPNPSRSTMGPGVDSASYKNGYQESSWWLKRG
jgi:hypothetical protein